MSDGNKFSLINLDGASDVVIKLLDMVQSATGWVVTPKCARADFEKGVSAYIESIENDDQLNGLEKAAKISTARREVKQYINQTKIIAYAAEDIKDDAPMDVDDDWLMYFFEYAKNVSEEYLQKVWGKLFSFRINGNRGVTKSLINIFSLIGLEDIETFRILCSMVMENEKDSRKKYPFVYIKEYPSYYHGCKIRRYKLAQLHNLGLIEYDIHGNFVLPSMVPTLRYGINTIMLKSRGRITYGNVRLTNLGSVLYDMTKTKKSNGFIDNCTKIWHDKGIEFDIKEK